MKHTRFLLIIFSSLLFSQNQEATLHFKDGQESIRGYGEIFQFNKIRFSLDFEGESSIWTGDIVKGITFHEFERDIDFEYTFTKSFKRSQVLLRVLVFGEVTLYYKPVIINSPMQTEYGNYFVHYISSQYKINRYYVRRNSEPYATRLKGNFKKRIKNHQFRWSTLPELVEYYNNFCTDF